jgi:hypothetical protein
MRFGKIICILLTAVAIIGFFSIGSVKALDFADWSNTWFKVKITETGKAGTVFPPGGKIVTNNEKTFDAYLIVQSYDFTQTAFVIGYCTFDGTLWTTQLGLSWPIVGGEPTKYLTLFSFERQESQNIREEYWIPLEVKGKETTQTVGEINTASFSNLGGIFYEEIGTPVVTQRGAGSVKFTGTQVPRNKVITDVPDGCRITAP